MNAQRKRAKRQTAGALVAGLLGGQPQQQAPVKLTPSGKKSTAQPRPEVMVPPKGIGPVLEPNDNDVLCGRGGRINAHVGNVRFREIVVARKKDYLSPATKKLEKAHIAAQVVRDIRSMQPSGRFLKEEKNGEWFDIGDAKAIKKVGQALREDAQEVRNDNSDEDSPAKPTAKKSVPLPQQAVQPQPTHYPNSNNSQEGISSGYEPLAYQPMGHSQVHHGMGPPMAGMPGYPSNQYSNTRRNNAVSGAAAAVMEDFDIPEEHPADVAFGRAFHIAETRVPSELSGLTNSVLTGISAMSEEGVRSNLSGRRSHHRGQNFQAVRSQQLQQLRQAWEATNSNRTMQGSDLVARATMPATDPARSFRRSNSWQDGNSVADAMSWAENSLVGGGINDTGSIITARSMYSQQWRNDSDSLMEHLMQGSVNRGNQASYAQGLYRQSPPQPSGGASVAEMSITSGGLASLGSVKSIMSDLSANLVALDLAEPNVRDDSPSYSIL